MVKFYNNVILPLLLYFLEPGAQLQRRLQARLLDTAMRLYLHAQGCQRWAKWEVAAKAPQLPLYAVHVPSLLNVACQIVAHCPLFLTSSHKVIIAFSLHLLRP